MKICYIADIANLHTRRWAGDFAALGHEVLVLSDLSVAAIQPPDGVRVAMPDWNLLEKILAFRLTPRPYGNNRWKHLPLLRALGSFRPDLIHGMEVLCNGIATSRLLGPGGPPRIQTPWGNDILHDPFQSARAAGLVRKSLAECEHVVGNMPGLGNYLHEHFDVPVDRVSAFPWGADLAIFHPQRGPDEAGALRRRYNIPPRARVVLSPRNFSPYWGADTIVDAIPRLVKANPNIFLIILGGMAPAGYIEEQQRKLKWNHCEQHVHFIQDFLPAGHLAALFRLAEVFISAPRTDFLAQTLLEGMACGCVPVCRLLNVYRERVQPGRTGCFVPEPFDAESLATTLLDLLADREALQAMSDAAARQAGELDDCHRAVREMARVYAKVTGKPGFLEGL